MELEIEIEQVAPSDVIRMTFLKTNLPGVFEIELELNRDERGFFARTWCAKEFAAHGLNSSLVQSSVSLNSNRGTLRGIHYQEEPYAETKVVRCTAGAIYDVALDLRRNSPTFKKWYATELSAGNRRSLYIPEGCAHGFLTLTNDSEVAYQMSEFYCPVAGRGVRWNDPAFRITWPEKVTMISERDLKYPDFESQ